MQETKILSGSYDLNKFLDGGYETDIITTLYGPAGSGKTNLCMLATVSQVKKNKKVIFIDTEGGFSIDRFKQISVGEHNKLLNSVLILKPTSFDEQKKSFNTLLKELSKNADIGLIVVDGMTMLYRLEISRDKKEEEIFSVNKELAKQLRTLAEIARKKNIPVLVTNQIYYNFLTEDEWKQGVERTANPVGGDLLKYWSKCLIELKHFGGKRTLLLKKHRSLPEKELHYLINNEGIKRRGLF
jgi:DNA repair protein RadB